MLILHQAGIGMYLCRPDAYRKVVNPVELYIHIPFCRSKCIYCDFASWPNREDSMDTYVNAVIHEAQAQASILEDHTIETVFVGGGTPSILPAHLLQKLFCGVLACFALKPGAEFTTEANPGTLTEDWLRTAVACGVNRLSMGMQAYQPSLLKTLGRIHSYQQVEESVCLARSFGISNISLDLMFGLPDQTLGMWQETLDAALKLQPQHLSCYGLIPEEGTPLFAMLDEGHLTLPDEDTERQMYDLAITHLQNHGFEQYEISNFSLPGHACKHNVGYWRQVPYLGLGASAASMLPASWQKTENDIAYWRCTNPSDLSAYLRMAEQHSWHQRSVEAITRPDAQFETLMLGLRTTEGVSEQAYASMHNEPMQRRYGACLARQESAGLLTHYGDWWRLTRRGMDIQNSVLVDLMEC